MATNPPFRRVLIANRGETALRITRGLRDAGHAGPGSPSSIARTACAFALPNAQSTSRRPARIAAMPAVIARSGTGAGWNRARIVARRRRQLGHVIAEVPRHAGLVELEVAVAADAEELQVDAAESGQLLLVRAQHRRIDAIRHRQERALSQHLQQARTRGAEFVDHAAALLGREPFVLVDVRRLQPIERDAAGLGLGVQRLQHRRERAAGRERDQRSIGTVGAPRNSPSRISVAAS